MTVVVVADVVTDLPVDASSVIVRIPQPKTNVNWYDFVKATPTWAKKLEKEMGIGKTQVKACLHVRLYKHLHVRFYKHFYTYVFISIFTHTFYAQLVQFSWSSLAQGNEQPD